MTHWSENSTRLQLKTIQIRELSELQTSSDAPDVSLFWFPADRTCDDAKAAQPEFERLAAYCSHLSRGATVCILTTAPDAAILLPYLEKELKFQLWVAVKTEANAAILEAGELPNRHTALLVLTRYHGSLRHTKTRIQYTYCPACGKTTKDYGGKKHTYHEYGTLMSDVWRDIECNPKNNIDAVIDRLRDLFGLDDYSALQVFDLRGCADLLPQRQPEAVYETRLALEWNVPSLPLDSQLLNRDCIEALQSIPDNSIDFCFADPPYNLQKKYDRWNDALESIEYFAWCDQWLSQLYRVLKPRRTLAVLNIPLWAVRHFQHLASFMRFQSWIVWEALGFPVRMVMPAHYVILCFSKGEPRPLPGLDADCDTPDGEFLEPLAASYCLRAPCIARRNRAGKSDRDQISDLWSDIHRLKHNSRRVDHPCQLPPLLMRRLFALFTNPEETVLDCFNGAGTSTLVAQQMQRRFIGIELSTQYYQIAQQRHEQLGCGSDPFGKTDTTPKAKNSPVQRMPKQKYAVSKKQLQLDVKRIARQLGRLPSREEVKLLSKFPMEYYDRYFASWGEVCAAARTTGMSELPKERHTDTQQIVLSLDF